MGRPSKLSQKQCDDIEKRLHAGEKVRDIAKIHGISHATIVGRFSDRVQKQKEVAQQIVTTQENLEALPVVDQVKTINLAKQLREISNNLAGAANHGSATAFHLMGIARKQADKVTEETVKTEEGRELLQGISALTKISNDSAAIANNLLAANKGAPPPVEERKKQITMTDIYRQAGIIK